MSAQFRQNSRKRALCTKFIRCVSDFFRNSQTEDSRPVRATSAGLVNQLNAEVLDLPRPQSAPFGGVAVPLPNCHFCTLFVAMFADFDETFSDLYRCFRKPNYTGVQRNAADFSSKSEFSGYENAKKSDTHTERLVGTPNRFENSAENKKR